jgi:hypothetical protein
VLLVTGLFLSVGGLGMPGPDRAGGWLSRR